MASNLHRDREILQQADNPVSKLFAFLRLSGPGWLQSATTLGGGSLVGALYLGVLGGTNMLWLNLVAIVIGVIMLSAIAYVTLSTGKRPYQAINEYVNPVLGIGWVTATILANMIWILPQFSLCFDALSNNVLPQYISDAPDQKLTAQMLVSGIIAVWAFGLVFMSFTPGWMSRSFDLMLKLLVGMIVVCFVLAVIYLFRQGSIDWQAILGGFIPNFQHWNTPAPDIAALIDDTSLQWQKYWSDQIVARQRTAMLGVTATAVGINMTFLLPYSMLARGWDRPFRGLARFDLITALAIPFIIVTACIVITSAYSFHGKADANLLSNNPATVQQSRFFESAQDLFEKRIREENSAALAEIDAMTTASPDERSARDQARRLLLANFVANMDQSERKLAATLVKPNTSQLAVALAPLFQGNEKLVRLVFGLGALAMGFSTIMVLSLINGYAFAEILGEYDSRGTRSLGALAAVAVGFCWIWIWNGKSLTYLMLVASTFGAILLPIAYIAFFLLMNNRQLLGEDQPRGWRLLVWNTLMLIGVAGAIAQAYGSLSGKVQTPEWPYILGALVMFGVLAVIGFSARSGNGNNQETLTPD